MTKMAYQKAVYLTSAAELKQLPQDVGYEVAFIGRSNSGKSSALNTITSIKNLARTSSTPGRTQLINVFALDDERRLIDLPGYGYAKVPIAVRDQWLERTNCYLETRECLKGLVLMMDIRHPLKEADQEIMNWTVNCGVPLHILLTKADKLKSGAQKQALLTVKNALAEYGETLSFQLFSAVDRTGVEEARAVLDGWF